jgi:hypothetical protein
MQESRPGDASAKTKCGQSAWIRRANRRILSVEMQALCTRLLPLFAALLLALPGAGRGAAYLFCHGMGRVVDKCCCPSAAAAAAGSKHESCGAKVQAPDCCERIQPASGTATAASREKAAGIDGSVAALSATSPVTVQRSDRFARDVVPEPIEARAPPPRGPPLFIAHCSFLT